MVSEIVLDVEMTVERLGEGYLRESSFDLRSLVAHLVCRVDSDSTDDAECRGQREVFGPAHGLRHPHPTAEYQPRVLQRQVNICAAPVVLVVFEILHDLFGRITGIEPREAVHQRADDGDHDAPVAQKTPRCR